jgi:chromosome segregation protein
LLKLKKLHILGFKSFCDRTELKFHGDGVAAIVGPNGCGKSNIADAISWVLGEQSAKTLRGSRMEDVIFAGTTGRKPTSMAEVSLTLIDPSQYDGADKNDPMVLEVDEEMPAEDWEEAEVLARAAEETERLVEAARPQRADGAEDGQAEAGREVVLKVRRRRFQQQFRTGEIVVTRRLFRTGDSEYLLNGKLCRLRDIQEMFMGTGLGPESYALIEQGRIGQILSSRPTDRRAIIEEAAGVTKFKTKKRLAEARLEDSKQNLARVNDIFEEVTRQMNSLKRQASKAERYARLRDEMRAKLQVVLASKFAQLEEQSAELDGKIAAAREEMGRQTDAVAGLEREAAERTHRGYAIESEIRANGERLSDIKLESDRQQAQRRHNEERSSELSVRTATADAELAQARLRLAKLEEELSSHRQSLLSSTAELVSARQEVEASQKQAELAGVSFAELEERQEQSRLAILESVASLSSLRNQQMQIEERMAAGDREAQRLEAEMAAARAQFASCGNERGQIALEFESVSQLVTALEEEIARTRELLETRRGQESDRKARLDKLRAEYAAALGKKSSREAVIAEHGYSTESVRRLFQSGCLQGGLAPAGVLADFLEVEPSYEAVVEDFLRDELNYVVVKSWDAADEGLRVLRSDADGRATFLVHPEDSQARFSFSLAEEKPSPADESVVPLKHTIRVLNGFGKSLEVILPKLRDGYIVSDPAFARELALENPDAFFLSKSGECFHNVTVTGGKQRSEGPLSLKRELREVMRLVGELENAVREEEFAVLKLGREIKDLSSLVERLQADHLEAEKQAMTSGHALRQVDAEIERARERSSVCERDLVRLASERTAHEQVLEERRAEIAARERGHAELEQALAVTHAQLASLREQSNAAAHAVSERKARLATLEERHRSAESVLARIEQLVRDMEDRVNALASQIDAASAEKLERELDNQRIEERLVALDAERNACEARRGLLEFESEQVRARAGEIEALLREARQSLDRCRDLKADLSTAAVKLQSDAEYLAQTSVNELGRGRAELIADSTLPRVSAAELAGEERACQEMRARLEGMGPVNMMALEEYKETSERHTFLEGQRKDLFESIENTQATIKEIDAVSRQKFEEAFTKINENFQLTFRKLFGGGSAFMRLTDEENSAESGIDVVASPPGKRLQNVLLLSGGEKAMTALALLVSIFQYQPSPFCILDEVDAPLDDSNIGRFTELVKEMSGETQFVLITHSKKTMTIAPVLYGVTMQEPGVSKLVSVRFGVPA